MVLGAMARVGDVDRHAQHIAAPPKRSYVHKARIEDPFDGGTCVRRNPHAPKRNPSILQFIVGSESQPRPAPLHGSIVPPNQKSEEVFPHSKPTTYYERMIRFYNC